MSVAVLNTDVGLSATTLLNAESAQNITGAKSFNRSPNPPFVVQAGSANVPNLDADKVDGVDISTLVSNRIPYASSASVLANNAAFTFDGTTFTTPGQIAFPATQAASTDPNTLDDYEENSWTPTIGGSGGQASQVYAVQVGRYVKVGKLVTCWGRVQLSTLGTITTNAQIQGLPFAADATSGYRFAASIGEWESFGTSYVDLRLEGVASATAMTFYAATAAATGVVAIAQANLSANTAVTFTVQYMAAA